MNIYIYLYIYIYIYIYVNKYVSIYINIYIRSLWQRADLRRENSSLAASGEHRRKNKVPSLYNLDANECIHA